MKRKKETKLLGNYIISWSSTSKSGFRVKHRIWRESTEGFEDCIWHTETRLTDDPITIRKTNYKVCPHKFFGKVWIAQKAECKKGSTWKAIGEAVRQLELKEKEEDK